MNRNWKDFLDRKDNRHSTSVIKTCIDKFIHPEKYCTIEQCIEPRTEDDHFCEKHGYLK